MNISSKLKKWLDDNNFSYLSEGENAVVYVNKDDDITVKILNDYDNCWFNFADIAKRNYKANKHFPVIKEDKKVDGYYIFIMERLFELPLEKAYNVLEKIMVYIYYHNNTFNIFDSDTLDDINLDYDDEEKSVMYNDLVNNYPDIPNFIHILHRKKPSNCTLDLNPKNIMKRNDNQIVINDILF